MEGCWLCAGHTLYGSHDYEDPEDIHDDKEIECFYI